MKASEAAKLPMSFDEITAAWVTEALQQNYRGTEVVSLEQGNLIRGTASKVQLKLQYNDQGLAYGLPPSMYAKGGFDWHEVAFATSYRAEARFYAEWAPGIDANIPKGYYAGWNDEQGIALIEDLGLRPVTFGSGDVVPLDPDELVPVLRLLARIHAAYWDDPKVRTLRSLGERVGTNFTGFMLEPTYYARCISEPRGSAIPPEFHDPHRVMAGLKANWELVNTGPQTFCHGDPHQGNLFFETDGTPGYLDFQAYVRCASLHDVNYVIVGSLAIEDRRRLDRDLLALYLEELRSLGVKNVWSDDEALDRFRRHTMHGVMWFCTPPEMQPIEIVEAHGLRFGTAAADYDLARLLGV